jgi:uncharacterized protein (DUF1778 family)
MPARTRARKRPQLRTSMQVGMDADQHRLIGRAASVRHQPFSTFMRDAAIEKANRVLGIETATADTLNPALADDGDRGTSAAAVA